jgi:hypothetical protein
MLKKRIETKVSGELLFSDFTLGHNLGSTLRTETFQINHLVHFQEGDTEMDVVIDAWKLPAQYKIGFLLFIHCGRLEFYFVYGGFRAIFLHLLSNTKC